jgi:predicted dehydrogenase
MSTGQLNPARLLTHTFDLEQGPEAYDLLGSDEPSLGILLRYPGRDDVGPRSISVDGRPPMRRRLTRDRPRLGVVGAGAFARSVLLPPLARHADIAAVATATGISARASATRFGASLASTDAEEVLTHPDIDAVVIATRHDTHAAHAALALRNGKHVFVEKPLALSEAELREVEEAAAGSDATLMVGFNRRFAPQVVRIREELSGSGPLMITYRVNAGRLPRSHWTHDPVVGGGRIVGEGCHFVDVASYLAGGHPTVAGTVSLSDVSEPREDAVATTLTFPGGSVAQIVYSALGDPSLPKERLEVLGEAGAAVLDDFRELSLYRGGHTEVVQGKRDKGHRAELAAFLEACRSGQQPWPLADMAAVTRATFAMRDAVAPVASPG